MGKPSSRCTLLSSFGVDRLRRHLTEALTWRERCIRATSHDTKHCIRPLYSPHES